MRVRTWRPSARVISAALQRLEVLHQVGFFLLAEVQAELRIVVVHYVAQRREATVVIEAAFEVGPQSLQGSRAIAPRRPAVGPEVVDAELLRSVHIPAGLGVGWRHVTARALFRPEQFLAA